MPPLIELAAVSRYFQMGHERVSALDGVTFQIDRGEMVAIIGSSGCGKSTLLNILGCLDTPSRGTYVLDTHAVHGLADDDRARLRNRRSGSCSRAFI